MNATTNFPVYCETIFTCCRLIHLSIGEVILSLLMSEKAQDCPFADPGGIGGPDPLGKGFLRNTGTDPTREAIV